MQDQVYPGESSAWNITASEAPLTYRLLLIHDTTLQCTLQYNIPGARQNHHLPPPPLRNHSTTRWRCWTKVTPPAALLSTRRWGAEVKQLTELRAWVYCSVMRIYALIGGGRIQTEMLWWQKGLNIESVPLQRPAVALRVPCCVLPTCKLAALVWATGSHLTD